MSRHRHRLSSARLRPRPGDFGELPCSQKENRPSGPVLVADTLLGAPVYFVSKKGADAMSHELIASGIRLEPVPVLLCTAEL